MVHTTPAASRSGHAADPFVHPALFYRGDEEYLAGLVPFVEEGLRQGQPVAVAVPTDRLRLLRAALGDASERIKMIDMTEAGRNPGRIIPTVLRAFADAHPGEHVRIIGEPIWPTRSAVEYPACVQHEALINLAFSGRDLTILCPYDVVGLAPGAVADAFATHPEVWESDDRYVSERYAPDEIIAQYNEPLEPGAGAVEFSEFTVHSTGDLAAARRFAVDQALRLGLAPGRVPELELIVTELATNSLVHAGTECRLSIWRDAGAVLCAARDGGRLTDPLAGRRVPAPDRLGGRGLLLLNRLADLVRTHTGPAGTTIQAHLTVDPEDARTSV
jgi:anti-sigma regulatory factor (Ser/Thr protein kinase)